MDCLLVARDHKSLCGISESAFGGLGLGMRSSRPSRPCFSPLKPSASLKSADYSNLFVRNPRSGSATPYVAFDSHNSYFTTGGEQEGEDQALSNSSLSRSFQAGYGKLVPLVRPSVHSLSQEMAMALVLPAAGGTGWTTGSGLEGPSVSLSNEEGEACGGRGESGSATLTKSPRRKMRVAFTCNVCGERTTRAINPHAYTDGTVFVQCKGCNVFHKLVDNLNLFHELKGHIFKGQLNPSFPHLEPFNVLHSEDFPFL